MLDVLLLHDADTAGLAEALAAVLADRGIATRAQLRWTPARVLVTCGEIPESVLLKAIDHGAAILPLSGTNGWLDLEDEEPDDLGERLVEAIEALIRVGARAGLADDAEVDRALVAVDIRLARMEDEPHLDRVCGVLALAIERGAPIYNAGAHDGCARLYLHTARALLARLEQTLDSGDGPLLGAVADELAGAVATVEANPDDEPDAHAWALRHCFDRILLARHTADAVHSLDTLFEDLRRAGRPLTASLVFDLISLAVSHGAPIYNAGSHVGCAQIYLCCARGLLDAIPAAPGGDEARTHGLLRESLPLLVDDADDRLTDDPTALAWDLRHAFDALVAVAAEERSWEHDS